MQLVRLVAARHGISFQSLLEKWRAKFDAAKVELS